MVTKKKSSSSVTAALEGEPKTELKIVNSPILPKPKAKRKVIAKTETLEEKAKRLEEKAEERHIVVVLTSTTHYKINWILIRRKFIAAGNIFRRKKNVTTGDKNKPVSSISNKNPGEEKRLEKGAKTKRSLWLRYCDFWNSKFNTKPKRKPIDENESLYESIDLHGKPSSVEDIIYRSEK